MSENGSENAAGKKPFRRACELCNEYTDHMPHEQLVYQIVYDANGGYHRHVAYCPDLGLRDEGKNVH